MQCLKTPSLYLTHPKKNVYTQIAYQISVDFKFIVFFGNFQMENIDKQHEAVKKSLFEFVNTHISNADLSVVDEIVLNYVIAILEEASEDPHFDVDGNAIQKTSSVFQFVFFMQIHFCCYNFDMFRLC